MPIQPPTIIGKTTVKVALPIGLADVGNRTLLAVDVVKQSGCNLLVFDPMQ